MIRMGIDLSVIKIESTREARKSALLSQTVQSSLQPLPGQ